MSVHLFGIRHHGPGCARSLGTALAALAPDCILVEGPPEADELARFAAHADLAPPVALLLYAPADPQRAVFYPFAEFSPEWQALRYAGEHGVALRFCDLPQTHRFALRAPSEQTAATEDDLHADPLRWLARAAGHGDTDTWWDHLVEQRADSLDLFAAIAEMMTALRTEAGAPADELEAKREAWMRTAIRQAIKEGHARIAVVCGAWHVPALAQLPSAKSDADLLKGLAKEKVAATWVPWTHGRLAFASGYGAGVAAPGWYRHLWRHRERAGLHWLTEVATLLRRHDLDASSAHVIEAARLADTLAALRDRPRAGLDELMEAVRAVFCYDSDAPLRVIRRDLLVDEALGKVPDDVPAVPLAQDVAAQQKRLRMAVRADMTELALDLRQGAHLEKSVLLHRLALLGIPWGRQQTVRGKTGTFHEQWQLAWAPEFAVDLIAASRWGGTLEAAATALAVDRAAQASTLPELTRLMETILLADLRAAVDPLMARIQEAGTLTPDLGLLLAALPSLVNVLRYGSARAVDTQSLESVVDGLMARACIALPYGLRGVADDAAAGLLGQIIAADQAVRLLQNETHAAAWFDALEAGAASDLSHPLLAGRCGRILTEQGRWDAERAARQLALRCSPAVAPLVTAHWLEGFLQGSGALLAHSDALWRIVNGWLLAQPDHVFTELLPLLRRTVATFSAPERRELGERAAQAGGTPSSSIVAPAVDPTRARRVLPILHTLFGTRALQETVHDE
ncbi:DUF5682 family protein [Massilia rhizosphaerae]|uniref:DUF5682 family protein n=1 Tax=Massilia rhizosphaerae TaxID=2784389 RepID=UPI0018DEAF99|nr:DUF5682 family protein [Massilia rhizosphaerae]